MAYLIKFSVPNLEDVDRDFFWDKFYGDIIPIFNDLERALVACKELNETGNWTCYEGYRPEYYVTESDDKEVGTLDTSDFWDIK